METKQHITLEVKKDEFTFVFHMPNGASWGNAIDASFDIIQHINVLYKKSLESIKAIQEEETK